MDADEINIVGKEEGYNYVFKDESKYSLKVRGLKADPIHSLHSLYVYLF